MRNIALLCISFFIVGVDSWGWNKDKDSNHEASVPTSNRRVNKDGVHSEMKELSVLGPLIYAAKYENLHALKILLKGGADIRQVDRNGYNALHEAAYYNYKNTSTMELLLTHPGTSLDIINQEDNSGSTPLDYAFEYNGGNKEMLRLLMSHGARRSLKSAAKYEEVKTVEALLEGGADLGHCDAHGNNALHFAAAFNHKSLETIKILLDHATMEVLNKQDHAGSTPLDYAYEINLGELQNEIIELLQDKGGERMAELQRSIFIAVENEEIEHVKYLLSNGAQIEYADKDGFNVLHYAAWFNKRSPDMMEFLLNYPDISPRVINKQDRRGHTPLDLALEQETPIQNILVQLLQDNGGKTKDDIQSTIFHAAELEDIEAVKSILDNGFDMSGTDDEGYNVLHYSVWFNKKNTDMIRYFLTHPRMTSDILNHRDIHGHTPLDLASAWNNNGKHRLDIIRLLKEFGAISGIRDGEL